MLRVRTSNSFDQPRRQLLDLPDEQHADAVRELRVVVASQDDVLPDRHVEDEPLLVAVLGDVADAGVADVLHRPPGDRGLVQQDLAGVGRPQADQRLRQLTLAVALDAGHAQDLAGADVEARGRAASPSPRRPSTCRTGAPISTFGLLQAEQHRPADHHLGELRLRRLGGRRLPDDRAAPQDGDPVGDLHDLVELVADEHDRLPASRRLRRFDEQVLRLDRREHRRRLVQDQDLHAAVQRLQDLDALLLTDGEVLDRRASGRTWNP